MRKLDLDRKRPRRRCFVRSVRPLTHPCGKLLEPQTGDKGILQEKTFRVEAGELVLMDLVQDNPEPFDLHPAREPRSITLMTLDVGEQDDWEH